MRRVITQIGQSIYEWLFTRQAQDNMVALAKLSAAVLGTSTQFNGLAVSPTSPASMQVSVAPGELYMLSPLESTIYGTLAADTTHQILKQGISLDATLLTLATPSVSGQSINYLIQATFQETDISIDPTSGTSPVVLQFYNDSNPSVPYSGPNNSGATSNTFRQGSVVLSAKAGISATTGSQVTPSPDSGYVGIAVVTVANGQTTITSGNISNYAGAPVINPTLHGLSPVFSVPVQVGQAVSALQAVQFGQVSGVVGQSRNLAMTVSTASATATLTADEVVVESALGGLRYCVPNVNVSINLATTGIGGMDTGSAPVSGFVAIYLGYNPTTGVAGLFATNATSAKATEVYTGTNRPAGYTATALVAVVPTNASSQFAKVSVQGREVNLQPTSISTTTMAGSFTSISIASIVPLNAKTVDGNGSLGSTTATNYLTAELAADSAGFCRRTIALGYASNASQQVGASFSGLLLLTAQTIYYTASTTGGTTTLALSFSKYTF